MMNQVQGEKGRIGLALNVMGSVPYGSTFLDEQAQERSMDYNDLGWFLEPVVRGDYPFSMRPLVKDRLPHFNPKEQEKASEFLRHDRDQLPTPQGSPNTSTSHQISCQCSTLTTPMPLKKERNYS
jgi:beta-glucosidase/6-phospho-beta-glucosidase/beta-galactosidase